MSTPLTEVTPTNEDQVRSRLKMVIEREEVVARKEASLIEREKRLIADEEKIALARAGLVSIFNDLELIKKKFL